MTAEPMVTVELGEGTHVRLTAGKHDWSADEPPIAGGTDEGPTPYDMLLGSLGACTALTLRLYARHKKIAVDSVHIDYRFSREHARDCEECEEDGDARLDIIRAHVVIRGDITDDQKDRLRQIASRCPVHRTLEGGPKMFETVEFAV